MNEGIKELKRELELSNIRIEGLRNTNRQLFECLCKVNESKTITKEQRQELADYCAAYLQRGIQGVWYELATGIAAMLKENKELRKKLNEK
jgi:hypothetical protein